MKKAVLITLLTIIVFLLMCYNIFDVFGIEYLDISNMEITGKMVQLIASGKSFISFDKQDVTFYLSYSGQKNMDNLIKTIEQKNGWIFDEQYGAAYAFVNSEGAHESITTQQVTRHFTITIQR